MYTLNSNVKCFALITRLQMDIICKSSSVVHARFGDRGIIYQGLEDNRSIGMNDIHAMPLCMHDIYLNDIICCTPTSEFVLLEGG